MGGSSQDDVFKKAYSDTLNFYASIFKQEPNSSWEPVEERFASRLFDYASINVHRLARIKLMEAFLPPRIQGPSTFASSRIPVTEASRKEFAS